MTEQDFIIRLDDPVDTQTYLNDTVNVEGWILVPTNYDIVTFKQQLSLDFLVSDLNYYESLSHVGTAPVERILSLQDHKADFYVEYLELTESDFYNSPDLKPDGSPKVSGTMLRVGASISRKESILGIYGLKIGFTFNNARYISNQVSLRFSNRTLFGLDCKGGPLHPIAREITAGYNIQQGWFYKGSRTIKSVVANVDGAISSKVYYGDNLELLLWSLPDIDRSEVVGIELISKFPEQKHNYKTSFNLDITFEDSSTFSMFWGNSIVIANKPLLTIIDTLDELYNFVINGYFSAPTLDLPKFILLTSVGEKEIPVEFVKTKILTEDNGLSPEFISGKVSFSITISKGYFSGFLGSVDIAIRFDDGEMINSSGILIKKRLSSLLNNIQESKESQGIKSFSKKILSSGVLPVKISQGQKQTEKQNQKNISDRSGLSFFYHNLSLTEGAPKVAMLLSEHLPALLSEAIASSVTFKSGEGDSKIASISNNFLVLPEGQVIWKNFSEYQNAFKKLLVSVEENLPKLTIVNSLDSFLAIDVLRSLNIPCIWIIHESVDPYVWYKKLPLDIRARFLKCLEEATKVVFVSASTQLLYSNIIPPENSIVIKNGIDAQGFKKRLLKFSKNEAREKLSISVDDIVFLSIGTTTERKGQDHTLRELKIFKDEYLKYKLEATNKADWKMLIVGAREIPFLDQLRKMITEFDLENNVILIPETPEVEQYYAASDLFILSSREESSPLVILEAYTAGLPVVSTLVFGLKDLIREELASSFNADKLGELSNILMEFIKDPAKKLEKASLASVLIEEEFSQTAMISKYSDLLKKLAA